MRASFPIYVLISDKNCLIIGGGKVAERKVELLLEYTPNLTVISPEATDEIKRLAQAQRIKWLMRKYEKGDLKGFFLVVAATNSAEVNREISDAAKKYGILCNVVDVPKLCGFYVPAIVSKGDLQIAISTSGKSPAFAGLLKRYIEKKMENLDAKLLTKLQQFRIEVRKRHSDDGGKRHKLMNSVMEKIDLDTIDEKTLDLLIEKALK